MFGSILSALASFIGFGAGRRELAKAEAPYMPPFEQRSRIAPTKVYRGGKHSKFSGRCPQCYVSTSQYGYCRNRMCPAFNGRQAHTHPALLSLDKPTRDWAIDRWNRGGMAALFAK